MNYIEAVKELVNNPKAEAIKCTGLNRTITKESLVPRSKFLLREDFTVVYKEEKLYTADDLQQAGSRAFDTGYKHGYKAATAHAERKAFKKFKEAMKELLGE